MVTAIESTALRTIDVEVAYNVRHLGGYATRSGRRTSENLVRSASLHRLTDAGAAHLADFGIDIVVDFRSSTEREHMATPELMHHGIRHVHAPVFQSNASPVNLSEGFQGYGEVYGRFLDTGRDAYRTFFETVATSEGRVLFHCAAGKDRTGVAAALLLMLAGVDDRDIVEDYSHSAALLKPQWESWQPTEEEKARATQITPELRDRLLASDPEDMEITILNIRSRWGSAEAYMASIGIRPATIERVYERMTA